MSKNTTTDKTMQNPMLILKLDVEYRFTLQSGEQKILCFHGSDTTGFITSVNGYKDTYNSIDDALGGNFTKIEVINPLPIEIELERDYVNDLSEEQASNSSPFA